MPESALPLMVHLFGSPALWVNHRLVRRLRTRKGYVLFAMLALRSGRAVERDFLAETLWPDSHPEQALSSLRRTLTDLRDALGTTAEYITAPTSRTLCLTLPDSAVDVLSFDALLHRAGESPDIRKEAIELYRGPFLEDCSEEWVLGERQRREETFRQAAHWLAEDARRQGDFCHATDYLRRIIAQDPLDEAAYRTLMRIQSDTGSVTAVVASYRTLCTQLHRTLHSTPSSATRELFQTLLQDGSFSSEESLPAKR